jgi:hypothetical protein
MTSEEAGLLCGAVWCCVVLCGAVLNVQHFAALSRRS